MLLEEKTTHLVEAGRFYPLGATLVPEGTNFALYSKNATEVWLLLFDDEDVVTDTIRLPERTRYVFHALVHGVRAGQRYGYRVRGPFDPQNGHRFNDNKLLLDPYAKAVTGKARNTDNLLLGYRAGPGLDDLGFDERDSASVMPKALVIDDTFDWQGDTPPNLPLEQLVIYEVHLKGFTAASSSRTRSPGTYRGFLEKIDHLVELGINAVEFLPLQERYVADFLPAKGLTNYWGYDTIGFFAPESTYRSGSEAGSAGSEVRELKTLVRELHKRNIEVILDVVYNHTAEGSELGPTISLRGVDNATYYVLNNGRYYENWSGTGNSLDLSNPHVVRFVMDSLRYWASVMHVDGFRFDLASILGREKGRFQTASSFFDTVAQDPVLSRVKLIAEPWDLGAYEVGNFPVDWSEWNGRFRDTVRKFEKGDEGQLKELGFRLTGSSDLYGDDGRSAYNTINFVTCHDGFTLADLVSHERKHNEANGEDNRDGSDGNASWNSGAEGTTDDPAIQQLREQRARNLICQLLFASGTPMLLGGDELLRTQGGNNNAYCQDSEISWFDWTLKETNRCFFRFVQKAIAFTRRHPVFLRRSFFHGTDITWYGPDGQPPSWENPELRTISYQLDGATAESGNETAEAAYLVLVTLNPSWNAHAIPLPSAGDHQGKRRSWYRVLDTALPGDDAFPDEPVACAGPTHDVAPRSTVVLLAR